MRRVIAVLIIAAALAVVPTGAAAPPKLFGAVGPGFTIVLENAKGVKVKTVRHGLYTFVVTDKAAIHSFHLRGPGVNKVITGVGFTGKKRVTVRLKSGRYVYFCDPHSLTMKGSVVVT